MDTKIDFHGKKIFVGLDVHKKKIAVCVIFEGAPVGKISMNSSQEGLVTYLKKNFEGAQIKCAYEAGFSGYTLHRHLEANGITCYVVHAASIEVSSRDRVKTDKRDALKIATQLSQGRLKSIRVPTIQEEQQRAISRSREQLIELRADIARQIKSKLQYFGLMAPTDDRLICEKYLVEIETKDVPAELTFVFTQFAKLWRNLTLQIKEFDSKLETQAKDDSKLEEVYRSVPGVGRVSSRLLANELGNLKQFSTVTKLYSFTGLTPTEFSSGEHVRKGHISRQGSSRIRKTLVECAWRALEKDDALKDDFTRISHRAGKKRAIVAVARRLIGRIRACFMKDCHYTLGFEPKEKEPKMI